MLTKFVIILTFYGALLSTVWGKDLGVWGKVYPVKEKNLLKVIEDKLAVLQEKGEVKTLQEDLKHKLEDKIANLKIDYPILSANESKIRLYDPTVILKQDIKNRQGHIIFKKGHQLNPLEHVKLSAPLLFINANNAKEESWVKAEIKKQPNSKIILIKGSSYRLSQQLNIPIYFDQNGHLSKRLLIQATPSKVTQQVKFLLIEEVAL